MTLWLTYCLLVTTFYKSSLMAVLTVPLKPPTINTLVELLNSDFSYGMIDAKVSQTLKITRCSELDMFNSLYDSDVRYERVLGCKGDLG